MTSFSLSMFLLGFIMHRLYLLSLLEYPAGPSTDERVLIVKDHDSTQLTCPCIRTARRPFFTRQTYRLAVNSFIRAPHIYQIRIKGGD